MAARKFLTPIDMTLLEIRNGVAHLLASSPGSPTAGQFYYNTTTNTLQFYNGTAFLVLGKLDQITAPAADVAMAGFKITGLGAPSAGGDASTKTYVDGQTLNGIATRTAATADITASNFKITNVTDPSNAQDAATKAYVDSQTAGARDVKDSVRVATAAALPAYTRTTNVITASANGALAAVDGVTLVATDRLLLKDGAAGADNGIYTLTTVGTGGTPYVLTRSTDADVSAEVTAGLYVWAEEGTANADTGWLLTTNNPITLNTTALTFTQVSALGQITAGAGLTKTGSTLDVIGGTGITVAADLVSVDTAVVARKFSVDVGDGSATSIVVTHNLGTLDVHVQVYVTGAAGALVECDVQHTTTNTVTLVFAVAPTSAQYRCTVVG